MSLQREILSPVTTAGLLFVEEQVSSRAKSCTASTPKELNTSLCDKDSADSNAQHGGKTILYAIQSHGLELDHVSKAIRFGRSRRAKSCRGCGDSIRRYGLRFSKCGTVQDCSWIRDNQGNDRMVESYKHSYQVTDSLIPIQQDQLVRSALRFANKIDKDR